MARIIVLDELTANQIAAGEVVERPSSVVKELVENSIDAGATAVRVDIRGGGIKYIRVSDNGCGIPPEDVAMAFERHATSKLRTADDLERGITTNGFRGEALASIASVSNLEMITKTGNSDSGTRINISGGEIMNLCPHGAPTGTTITVKDLFFNTPARYKFLKKDTYEGAAIAELLSRLALAHPEVAISLYSGGEKQFATTGKGDLKETIYSIFGTAIADNLVAVSYQENSVSIDGYIGLPAIARGNRANENMYCNGRLFRSKNMTTALEMGYGTRLMKKQYPFACVNIRVAPWAVDVNVHPQKTEVRFAEEVKVADALRHGVAEALAEGNSIPDALLSAKKQPRYTPAPDPEVQQILADLQVEEPRTPYQPQTGTSEPKTEKSEPKSETSEPKTDKSEAKPESNDAVSNKTTEMPPKAPEIAHTEPVKPSVVPPVEKQIHPEPSREPAQEPQQETGNREFDHMYYVGSLWNTYLIFQRDKDAILIDQHAAHERIRFERLLAEYRRGEIEQQQMLFPITVSLTSSEYAAVFSYSSQFDSLGVDFDDFGKNTIVVRAIPTNADRDNFQETFVYMLDRLMSGQTVSAKPDTFLYKIACTGAVKANQPLDRAEIDRLVEDLKTLDNPFNCPHGRPTAIKLTLSDVEKMFRRIL